MRCSDVRIWFYGLLRPLSRSSSGASLLWAIAAITIVGGFAAAITSLSPSSMQGKLAGENGSQAYYAALSGVSYFKSLQDSARDVFKAKDASGRTISFGGKKFYIYNINSDSQNWYIDVVGSSSAGGNSEANYVVSNVIVARTNPITSPILDLSMDGVYDSGFGGNKVTKTTDSSSTTNDGVVKSSSKTGLTVSSDGVVGNSFLFKSANRARIVHKYVEDYNIFFNGTITVFLYPLSPVSNAAGIVHKGVSPISCDNTVFTDEVYTFQFWPGPNSTYVYHMVLIEGGENTSCSKTDKSCLCAGSSGWKIIQADSKTPVAVNQWQYAAVTWEQVSTGGLDIKFYINGSLDSTTHVSDFKPRRNQADLIVGGQSDSNNGSQNSFYNGYMDELAVYNRALTAAEIKSDFQTSRTGYCNGYHNAETMCKAKP